MICKQTPDLFLQMAMGAQRVTRLISWVYRTMENVVLFLVAKMSFRIGGHQSSKHWGLLFKKCCSLEVGKPEEKKH